MSRLCHHLVGVAHQYAANGVRCLTTVPLPGESIASQTPMVGSHTWGRRHRLAGASHHHGLQSRRSLQASLGKLGRIQPGMEAGKSLDGEQEALALEAGPTAAEESQTEVLEVMEVREALVTGSLVAVGATEAFDSDFDIFCHP